MDGRRGAKSKVDREGGWGRDKEVDGRKPRGRQGRASARQSPPKDQARLSSRDHSDGER